MKIKVETEKKYYCVKPEKLVELVMSLGFVEIKRVKEIDEYFTDINSEYIKNRTCLRIRKYDDNKLELTFKGKSSTLEHFCKLENNISCNASEYDNLVNLLSSIGYYSYVIVEKDRMIYEYRNDKYIYSIMIDTLPNIGGFVEFEIISDREDSSKCELQKELELFVSKFDELNLDEAVKPYRDIVANYIYDSITKGNESDKMYINIDLDILMYEKEFFKKYQKEISNICGYDVKWDIYKNDNEIDSKISLMVDEYLDNLIFDNKELLVMLDLLKQIDYKILFVTKVNKLFFDKLFKKLNRYISDIIYLSDDSLLNEISIDNSIYICDKNLKEVNSNLLIIINNK